MLVSFTQTYGDNRHKLYEIYSRDKQLIDFKNRFDVNIHSFHNCSLETIEYFKSLNKVRNSEYIIFNDIGYGECIKILKERLRELKCTHFFFSQDDTFASRNYNYNLQFLLDYVKSHNKDFMLSFQYHINTFKNPIGEWTVDLSNIKSENISDEFKIYFTDTFIFKEEPRLYSIDDTPFISTIDMIEDIYDDEYCKYFYIYECEPYINKKYRKNKINRYILELDLFRNFNFIGQCEADKKGMWYTNKKYIKGLLKSRGVY